MVTRRSLLMGMCALPVVAALPAVAEAPRPFTIAIPPPKSPIGWPPDGVKWAGPALRIRTIRVSSTVPARFEMRVRNVTVMETTLIGGDYFEWLNPGIEAGSSGDLCVISYVRGSTGSQRADVMGTRGLTIECWQPEIIPVYEGPDGSSGPDDSALAVYDCY